MEERLAQALQGQFQEWVDAEDWNEIAWDKEAAALLAAPSLRGLRELVDVLERDSPAPSVPGCTCRDIDEEADGDAPVVLCDYHAQKWGPLSRDTLLLVVMDFEAAIREIRDAFRGAISPEAPKP